MSATALHARPSGGYDTKLAHARGLLRSTATAHGDGVVQATSLGAEDMVITDLISRANLPISLGTLDTGLLHAETLALLPRIEARYGLRVEAMQPGREAVIQFVARHGERSMFESIAQRKACCALRKLEPLARLLAGKRAWITGLRREQSGQRANVPFTEAQADGCVKVNPLADWTWGDVWHYIATNEVPYNPLHDQFYPSIGCAPCTRAISLGEDMRAGRWWWEDEAAKECGLHIKNAEGATA